jgi:hypothetical protein
MKISDILKYFILIKKPEGVTQDTYRVKDQLEYLIDIFEYDYKTSSWKPFLTDDLQLEFTMMNPYYIHQMKMLASNQPTYFVNFRVICINIGS